jgi:hypothetical protein
MSGPASANRPLEGRCIGISISESDDLASLGFLPPEAPGELPPDLQRVLAELTVALVSAGATIVYGGDMREGGFTLALMQETAAAYRAAELNAAGPVFVNVLAASAWQGKSAETIFAHARSVGELGEVRLMLPDGDRIALEAYFEPQPENVEPAFSVTLRFGDRSEGESAGSAAELERLLAGASAMSGTSAPGSLTMMRRAMAAEEHGRVVIGGRVKGYGGGHPDARPGIGEEALLTLEAGKRLLAVASFGGAAHDVANALGLLPDGPFVAHADVGPNYWETMAEIAKLAAGHLPGAVKQSMLEAARADTPARIAAAVLRAMRDTALG